MKNINEKGEHIAKLMRLLIDRPAEEKEFELVVALAPHRGFIKDIKLNGVSCQKVGGVKHEIWRGRVPASTDKQVKLEVEQFGEPPRVETQEFVAPDNETDAAAAIARANTQLDDRMRELLGLRKQKGQTRAARMQPAHKLFLRFDAWTYPSVANLMRDPAFRTSLANADSTLEDFYFSGINTALAPLSSDMGSAMDDLFDLMRERPLGMLGHVNGQATAAAANATATNATAATASAIPAETLQRFDKIAEFLENLFDSEFPPIASGSAQGQVSRQFEHAFAAFATGNLSLVNGAPESSPDLLNTEPNSANFLCFVELCLRAIALRPPERKEYWFSMARMFTALITPFCMTYASDEKPRDATNYLRTDRFSAPVVSVTRAMKRIDAARARMPDSQKLAMLERRVAAELLWALYDDLDA